jgi:hypothetical protein
MLSPKGKMFYDVSLITLKSFIKFGGLEDHIFEFQSWSNGKPLKIQIGHGPPVSRSFHGHRAPEPP